MDAGLFGKVDLSPVPGAAQFPDSLTRRRTDFLCHAYIIGLVFALYLVHALSYLLGGTISVEVLWGRHVPRPPAKVHQRKGSQMKLKMKQIVLFTSLFLGIATLLYAQQQYRREHMICPIDGARMDWTGNQQGMGNNSSCEFSHVAYAADGKRADHKAWASCTETR